MKNSGLSALLLPVTFVFGIFLLYQPASGQENTKSSTVIPADVNKILTVSCVPCHTSQGGLMSKSKLNLTEWANYPPEKQKEKAIKMYSELNKGAMPPKKAREMKPELIPTKDQIEIIKKWSESFPEDQK